MGRIFAALHDKFGVLLGHDVLGPKGNGKGNAISERKRRIDQSGECNKEEGWERGIHLFSELPWRPFLATAKVNGREWTEKVRMHVIKAQEGSCRIAPQMAGESDILASEIYRFSRPAFNCQNDHF